MSTPRTSPFLVGEWLVDPSCGRLIRDGQTVSIRPKEMELLCLLASRPGEVFSTDEILEEVWAGVVVGHDALYAAVSQLRKALGDDAEHPKYLQTLTKRGYRLVAELSPVPRGADTAVAVSDPRRTEHPSWSRPWLGAAVVLSLVLLVVVTRFPGPAPDATNAPAPGDGPAAGTLAVLPFDDLSAAGNQAFFAHGIAEELIHRLASVPELDVVARTSSFAASLEGLDAQEIGRRLGVESVLTGSVRRDDRQVRITAQLIDAGSGFNRWSASYQREMSNLFALQDDISDAIVHALRPDLEGMARDTAGGAPGAEAYDAYLQGLARLRSNSFQSLLDSRAAFRRTIELAPGFAPGHAGLARTLWTLYGTGAITEERVLDAAQASARRALALNPRSADALTTLGLVADLRHYDGAGDSFFRQALAIAPNHAGALIQLADNGIPSAQPDATEALFYRALAADPYNPDLALSYARFQVSAGRVARAERILRRAADLYPDNASLPGLRGLHVANHSGRIGDALALFLDAARLDPQDHGISAAVAMAFAALGDLEAARNWVKSARSGSSTSGLVFAAEALCQLAAGDRDGATAIAVAGVAPAVYQSYGSDTVLFPIAVDGLLAEGRTQAAQDLIANTLPGLPALLKEAPPEDFVAYSRRALPPMIFLTVASAFDVAGRHAERDRVMRWLAAAGLASAGHVRENHLPGDYLVEAGLSALRGDTDGTIAFLEDAYAHGFRNGWQLHLEHMTVFRKLPRQQRLQALLKTSRNDLERQYRTLEIGDARDPDALMRAVAGRP